MIPLTLDDVARRTGGRAVGDPSATVQDVGADSRRLPDDALFVALPPRGVEEGERDGHDFVDAAFAAGAVGALVEREDVLDGRPGVVVDDTWSAIARLAGSVRAELGPKVVALTGSVGKTTTKDLIRAACQSQRETVAARGSFNNELGVPLTLLSLTPATEVAVVEIGARGIGHIASLMPAVRPDVSIVTIVAGAHLEQFGSLDGVAKGKGEIVEGLGPEGTAVLNLDDHRVRAMADRHDGAVLTFSASGDRAADLWASDVALDDHARATFTAHTPWGTAEVRLPLAGRHHVGNALAALAAAGAVGVDLAAAAGALATAEVSQWRSSVEDVGGVRVLNDAYNANPTSTVAALDALREMDVPGRRFAVLGIMAELGDDHVPGHRRVGEHAVGCCDVLVVVGDAAEHIAAAASEVVVGGDGDRVVEVRRVPAAEGALEVLGDVRPGDAVLVKASRSGGLEVVADGLVERLRAPDGGDEPGEAGQ